MALVHTNPNDALPHDADLDLAWPEPKVEISESIGRGKLWRFTFDDGFVVTAMPGKGARVFRLTSPQMMDAPYVYSNRSKLSWLIPEEVATSWNYGDRCGWLDIYKVKKKDEWIIGVRVQSGAVQSYIYPTFAHVPDKISPFNQVMIRPASYTSREEAIAAGAGVYYAATRKMAGEISVDNHDPIIRVMREESQP